MLIGAASNRSYADFRAFQNCTPSHLGFDPVQSHLARAFQVNRLLHRMLKCILQAACSVLPAVKQSLSFPESSCGVSRLKRVLQLKNVFLNGGAREVLEGVG